MSTAGSPGLPPAAPSGLFQPPRHQSSWWVLAGTVATGIGTYVLLVVTARAVGPDAYGNFGVFWASTVIVGLGLFLPVEQETTRRGSGLAATGHRLGSLWRRSSMTALRAAGVAVLGMCLAWFWLSSIVQNEVNLLIAFALACLGYSLQFPARGILAATRQFRAYGVVVIIDAILRAVVAAALWLTGVTSVGLYALAVGGASVVAGLTGLRLVRSSGSGTGGAPVERFGRDSARLVVAASSMQILLNSGTLVAKVLATSAQAALAGQFLAVMTIARLPVMVFQSLQSLYLSRLASRWHQDDRRGVRGLLALLAAFSCGLALLLVIGAAAVGPWVTTLIFGPDYALDRGTIVLVALGVGIYVVASVSSDASIAVGMHTLIVSTWVTGLIVGGIVVVLATSLVGRATLPLIVGSALAGVVLVVALIYKTGWGREG